jgi:hypothetical protein
MSDPDALPDVRLITISLDVEGEYDPAVDIEGLGDYEALGVLTVVRDRLRWELAQGGSVIAVEDDDEEEPG